LSVTGPEGFPTFRAFSFREEKATKAMVRIHWQDQELDVRRLVVSRSAPDGVRRRVRGVAREQALAVAEEDAEPRQGDFWLGCLPEKGWAASLAQQIAWVRGPEVYLALARLRHAPPAGPADAPVLVRRAWQCSALAGAE
jgi:hypothetical protein